MIYSNDRGCQDCNELGSDPRTDTICRSCKGTGIEIIKKEPTYEQMEEIDRRIRNGSL